MLRPPLRAASSLRPRSRRRRRPPYPLPSPGASVRRAPRSRPSRRRRAGPARRLRLAPRASRCLPPRALTRRVPLLAARPRPRARRPRRRRRRRALPRRRPLWRGRGAEWGNAGSGLLSEVERPPGLSPRLFAGSRGCVASAPHRPDDEKHPRRACWASREGRRDRGRRSSAARRDLAPGPPSFWCSGFGAHRLENPSR